LQVRHGVRHQKAAECGEGPLRRVLSDSYSSKDGNYMGNFLALLAASFFALFSFGLLASQMPADASAGLGPAQATSGRTAGTVFRDCPECPEMVVVPAGTFTMGSAAAEKSWAATHGGNLASVADESPQHQ